MGEQLATSMTQIGNSEADLIWDLAEMHSEKRNIHGFQAKLKRDAHAADTIVQTSCDVAQP